ncbi:hypothetical protein LCM10_04720 [Rossellomorea aquimaris]|uniref:antitoxin VbhA family protein n=1 Tax=Rossellomorea aquimaris TaxID=189382 RepID=UPI001CD29E24|nr:antitoxin VbhA family protein [Rossellomorea aquimaris]MCA1054282.1 hypothetical protein [Rossellomorea aquimaris]
MDNKVKRVLDEMETFSTPQSMEFWEKVLGKGDNWMPFIQEMNAKGITVKDVRAAIEQVVQKNENEKMEQKLERAMRNAKANLELSGFQVTSAMDDLVRRSLVEKMDDDQFRDEVLRAIKVKDTVTDDDE